MVFSIWVAPLGVSIFTVLSLLLANVLGNFPQQQFVSPTSQCRIILYSFVWNSDFFFFKLCECGRGDVFNRSFFPCQGVNVIFQVLFDSAFFTVFFLNSLIAGKIQELIGSFFIKMIYHVMCSMFQHVENSGLHIYSYTSVFAYCRG